MFEVIPITDEGDITKMEHLSTWGSTLPILGNVDADSLTGVPEGNSGCAQVCMSKAFNL